MRLLHVIHGLSPAGGGPPENLRQLSLAFRQIGVEVEVLSQDSPEAPYLGNYPFRVHALGPSPKYGHSPKLLAWLRTHATEYDGVVVEGLWQYNGLAVRKAVLGKMPYIVFTHGMLDPWFRNTYPLKHVKKSIYWFVAQHAILRDAYRVVFTSPKEEELSTKNFWPRDWKSVVVPLGSNRPTGDPKQQREAFYACCPSARNRRFLLFLGRIHEKKGCDLLIEAFSRVASTYPQVDLVIAGPDRLGLRARLQTMAANAGIGERVHWSEMLEAEAKWGALHACEALVLPSHQENFGLVIAEAIACSKPVLVSDKVNIWHYVTEDAVGFVEDDTVDGTERLLHSWLRLTAEAKQAMIDRTAACFDKRFSMRSCALALRGIFEDALAAD